MFVHHLAYRHQDGGIEEFAGSGLTPAAARQQSVSYARMSVAGRAGDVFALSRVIDTRSGLGASGRAGRNAAISTQRYIATLL